jgi:hypothetical protein
MLFGSYAILQAQALTRGLKGAVTKDLHYYRREEGQNQMKSKARKHLFFRDRGP